MKVIVSESKLGIEYLADVISSCDQNGVECIVDDKAVLGTGREGQSQYSCDDEFILLFHYEIQTLCCLYIIIYILLYSLNNLEDVDVVARNILETCGQVAQPYDVVAGLLYLELSRSCTSLVDGLTCFRCTTDSIVGIGVVVCYRLLGGLCS